MNTRILIICSLGFLAFAGRGAVKPANQLPTLEQQMLSHVEKILVVDTVNVDKYEFFRRYRLQPSAGTILSGAEVGSRLGSTRLSGDFIGEPFTGFTNEFGDYMIWAHEDTTGYLRLAESVRLGDGSWSTPTFTPTVLNNGTDDDEEATANAAFPFMLDDGQTLYFASDNAGSLGGYDIFIATKDPSDGEFLIPGNLGMPFNSTYDDYMMALDPLTGIGWWASDRNQLEDQVTIYIYALSDERINVETDDADLLSYASLSGWENLLSEDQQSERKRLLKEIASIGPQATHSSEFELQMPGGLTYNFISDFKNKKAASQMQLFLGQKTSFDKKKEELKELRHQYAQGDRKLSGKIRQLEEQLRSDEKNLRSLLSEIYKMEQGN